MDWPHQEGVVTITFDDCFASSYENGAAILNRHDVKATYYVSLGLVGGCKYDRPFFTEDNLQSCAAEGHEIGCHTFSHLDLGNASPQAIRHELDQNHREFEKRFPQLKMTNFSFPSGSISRRAKRSVEPYFESARSIAKGVNSGRIDLNELLAVKLYSHLNDLEQLKELIAENARTRSWLIFYTHDVDNDPTEWGCRPDELEAIVETAVNSTNRVLTVREAMSHLRQAV